jgi:Arabinose-binding domain of AraC transcription regulator, N-term
VTIGQAISVEMFSPPLFAALYNPNLQVAVRRIATYKPLIGPMRVGITQDRAGLTVTYHWPAGMTPPQLLAMTELVFWVALALIATRHHVRPAQHQTSSGLPLPAPSRRPERAGRQLAATAGRAGP